MKNQIRLFNQYVKQFDLNEKAIMRKFHHTFRVMEYAMEITTSLKLNEEDIKIAGIIGLLHDIGRFKQWERYQTYRDKDSVDHADLGVQILKENNWIAEFVFAEDIQELVLKAVKNHNKLEVEPMNERELLFTNIIRDADKLDILIELYNQINSENPILNEKLIQSIEKKELCKNKDSNGTDEDHILRSLAFLFDIHFDYTIRYLQEKGTIQNKINLLETYFPNNSDVTKIKEVIQTYIEERMNKNVR